MPGQRARRNSQHYSVRLPHNACGTPPTPTVRSVSTNARFSRRSKISCRKVEENFHPERAAALLPYTYTHTHLPVMIMLGNNVTVKALHRCTASCRRVVPAGGFKVEKLCTRTLYCLSRALPSPGRRLGCAYGGTISMSSIIPALWKVCNSYR